MAIDDQTQNEDLSLEQLEELAEEVTQEPSAPDAPAGDPLTPSAPTPPPETEAEPQPEITPLDRARADLLEAERDLDAAQTVVKDALEYRNACSQIHVKLRRGNQLTLHELNQQQKSITRVENARRFRAQEAIDKMVGHYRPGKRGGYPLSDAVKSAVGDREE